MVWGCLLTFGSCALLVPVNIHALKFVWACLLTFGSCALLVTVNLHALKLFMHMIINLYRIVVHG